MRLTAAARRHIPPGNFAGPGRSFPDEDRTHAIAALRDAHFASNPAAIKAKVHRDWPGLDPGKARQMRNDATHTALVSALTK